MHLLAKPRTSARRAAVDRRVRPQWPVIGLLALASLPVAGIVRWIGPRWTLAAVFSGLAFGIVTAFWPLSALWMLIPAAGANRYAITVGGLSLYAEYVALGLVVAVLAWQWAQGRLRWRWPTGAAWLAGWLLIALLASILHAPDTHNSLVLWSKLLLMVVTYLVVANLVHDHLAAAVFIQCITGAAVAAYGLLALLAWRAAGIDLGMLFTTNGVAVPMGSQWEPNIFGSYVLAALLLALPLALTGARLPGRLRVAAWAAVVFCLPALLASLTRTAWLGLALAVLLALAIWTFRQPRAALSVTAAALAAACVFVVLFAVSDLRSLVPALDLQNAGGVLQRLSTFADLGNDGNVWVRMQIIQQALDGWRGQPWIGWGVGAFSQVYYYPNADLTSWIPNLFVHYLYDTGVVGLALLVGGLGLIAARGIQAWWRCRDGVQRASLAGLLLALLGLLVAFQATEASWLAYPWIYLALLAGAALEDTRLARGPAL